jgi:DNA-binding response OmpR family regulator
VKILLIEDEILLAETIITFLDKEGYRIEYARTLEQGNEKVNLYEYDCLLVDIGLPDGNGLSIVKEIKKCHPETGIIIISAKNSLDDKVLGLDLGADDYLTKPFHLSELNSRIKSLLRRRKFDGQKEFLVGNIRILPDNRQVFVGKEQLAALFDATGKLLETEFEIEEGDLPQAVKATIAKDFAGYKLDEIEKSTDAKGIIAYEMEATKAKTKLILCFDANGKLVSKDPVKKEEKEEKEDKK